MGGTAYVLDLANGGMRMVYNETLAGDAINAAKEAEAGIIDGSIAVGELMAQ